MKLGKRKPGSRARARGQVTQKLRKLVGRGPQRVALAWYREDQWARLRQLAADPEAIEERFEDWRESAERTLSMLRSRGAEVEQVLVDVEAAAAWGAQEGRPFDAAARAAFVAELANSGRTAE